MEKEFDWIKTIYGKITAQMKVCFVSAVVIGFVTHLFMLTHKLPNWDDINCFANAGATEYVGRWFLDFLKDAVTKWSNPWINGSISIFLLAFCCCLIVSILDLRSKTSAVLTALLVMTFPSVESTMAFMFTVDMYMFGLFLILLGVYLTRKFKLGFIPAVILCILGMGTYQAYICFAITLFIFCIFLDAYHGKEGKELLVNIIKAVGVLLAGTVLYIGVSHLINPNLVNSEYAGAGEMGRISLTELPIEAARSYKRLLEYFVIKPYSFVTKPEWIANIIICLLIVVCFIWLMVSKKLWKKKLHFAVCLLTMAAAPLGIAFIYVMSPKASFSTLMMFQYVLVYILLLVLLEGLFRENGAYKIKQAAGILSVCLLVFVGCSHYVLAGEAYFRMELAKERVSAYYNRLLTRLELEGYRQGEAFLVLGHSQAGDEKYLPPEYYEMEDGKFADLSGISPEYGMLSSGVRENFFRVYFGAEVPYVEESQKEEILKSETFNEMPVYPQEGCVERINGIWVLKISEGQ